MLRSASNHTARHGGNPLEKKDRMRIPIGLSRFLCQAAQDVLIFCYGTLPGYLVTSEPRSHERQSGVCPQGLTPREEPQSRGHGRAGTLHETGWRTTKGTRALENNEVLMPLSPQDEIARYLSTGEHNGLYAAWPGESLMGTRAERRAVLCGGLSSLRSTIERPPRKCPMR